MAVTLRFQRHGSKGRPFYQMVATDSRTSRDGAFIEKLGYYDPSHEPSTFKFNEERVRHWYNRGAQLSPTVHNLLKKNSFSLKRVAPKD